ncbi:MAG TPA: T9SS type A sorting domain-containing protein [Chitinophagaceae bacterium]
MKRIFTLFLFGGLSSMAYSQTYHDLSTSPLTQNWTDGSLITANDNWSGIPSIRGFLGNDVTGATGAVPDTLLTEGISPTIDVIANQNKPSTLTSGGVAEFDGIINPTIALQGSGTADAPYIMLYLNTTGRQNINISFNARDIDSSADNAIQPIAVQYRIGNTGPFTNIYLLADATTGPSLGDMTTAVSVPLPANANNQAQVEVRIITANAAGSDEWVGIDDIVVSQGTVLPVQLVSFAAILSGSKVNVNWTTANEVNVLGYDVEKSINGKDFMPISMIHSEGVVSTKNYSYVDQNAVPGVSYYRLRMNDKDGSYKLSQVVMVKNSSVGVSIYPNPVRAAITVQHESATAGAMITIVSMNGKQLLSVNAAAGTAQTTIDASKLAPGAYMVIFNNNGTRASKQFIKE